MKNFILITTINFKTKAISEFEKMYGWYLVIVGDKKSILIENSCNLTFISVEEQHKLGFDIVAKLPYNHYTRKNIGYLYAMREGADVIYDTDGDNIPYSNWDFEDFECGNLIQSEDNFLNICQYFTHEFIWPRGLPLDLVRRKEQLVVEKTAPVKVGVWQGLADLDPDVDAVYRMIFNKPVKFERKEPVALSLGKILSFVVLSTLKIRSGLKKLSPTSICQQLQFLGLKIFFCGFIAQRLLWVSGIHLGYIGATVYQERSIHNLMNDFKDEVERYLNTGKVISVLQGLAFSNNSYDKLLLAYQNLHKDQIVSSAKLPILDAWRKDLKQISYKVGI